MKRIDFIREYFENETDDFHIKDITLACTKNSYLFSIKCYYITTEEGIDFLCFL